MLMTYWPVRGTPEGRLFLCAESGTDGTPGESSGFQRVLAGFTPGMFGVLDATDGASIGEFRQGQNVGYMGAVVLLDVAFKSVSCG